MSKKSLNVNDAWFGFNSHFKKGTLHVHMNNVCVNGLKMFERIEILLLLFLIATFLINIAISFTNKYSKHIAKNILRNLGDLNSGSLDEIQALLVP